MFTLKSQFNYLKARWTEREREKYKNKVHNLYIYLYVFCIFFGWLKQIKPYESKYFCSICICFTLICTTLFQTVGSAHNMALECVLSAVVLPATFLMLFGIRLCSFSTHESGEHPTTTPSRGGALVGATNWGFSEGRLLPLESGPLGNPITVDSPLRMMGKGRGGWVTAIAPLFSVITNLYRGNGCLSGHEWKINRFNRVSFVW